jgi:hypothetical protein
MELSSGSPANQCVREEPKPACVSERQSFAMGGVKEIILLLLAAIALVLAIAVAAWIIFHSARPTTMHQHQAGRDAGTIAASCIWSAAPVAI